jgi:hypothetical protein
LLEQNGVQAILLNDKGCKILGSNLTSSAWKSKEKKRGNVLQVWKKE